MINWIFYPKSQQAPDIARRVVNAFRSIADEIDSASYQLNSNAVLSKVADELSSIGFQVEKGKRSLDRVQVPVLFGMNGKLEKHFDADAYNQAQGFVIEVEAGRGVLNNQFLKDLFQACMMHDVKYLAVAVRNNYKRSKNFHEVVRFFDTLYASNRLKLLLEGVLLIGY